MTGLEALVLIMVASNFFFFNDTATPEIYALSLHDALPIYHKAGDRGIPADLQAVCGLLGGEAGSPPARDRKSTRLNSSHDQISYAVFCLKKKNIIEHTGHHHAG